MAQGRCGTAVRQNDAWAEPAVAGIRLVAVSKTAVFEVRNATKGECDGEKSEEGSQQKEGGKEASGQKEIACQC
jgi:hypothetical protein